MAEKMRLTDLDGYRQRAACICVRNEREDEILLITSRDKTSWIIPGGGIEQNETRIDAAHRELYEEAGVRGRVIRDLGIVEDIARKRRTNVFVIYVEHEYDDWDERRLYGRQRHWYRLNEVLSLLKGSKQSQYEFFQRFLLT
ncbi:unnamed protein product [Adineta ricciae]|uniref:diphosphoinositol-polyphosphate diphosphatase n=1 Tax=Adineta ricciae TaxID=249248 RepID=A0A814FH75_ADIRI|nr:unnamed protein product [Adineta ricciae]CAF1002479.1 unnamed protein product [Adineta ricciae]